MKEIVVAIDFSKSSIQAFHYALNIAKTCGCSIKLVYVSKKRDKESTLVKDEKGMETSIFDSFNKLISDPSIDEKIQITYKLLHGRIFEEITNQAKYTDANIIVMGAHGMSGFEEEWVGNNVMKVAYHSEKPVLIVKKPFRLKKVLIEKILLPIDSTAETLQKIPFTLQLARLYKSQINVLSICNSKTKNAEEKLKENTQRAMKLIIESGLRYINEKKVCDNISKATIDYAKKRNTDLISIMTEQEYTSGHSLSNVYAQQTINHSPFPVLCFKTITNR
jgi:nucleotide-binding universal stress UspA family protein